MRQNSVSNSLFKQNYLWKKRRRIYNRNIWNGENISRLQNCVSTKPGETEALSVVIRVIRVGCIQGYLHEKEIQK